MSTMIKMNEVLLSSLSLLTATRFSDLADMTSPVSITLTFHQAGVLASFSSTWSISPFNLGFAWSPCNIMILPGSMEWFFIFFRVFQFLFN
jgi:hypothetical protein